MILGLQQELKAEGVAISLVKLLSNDPSKSPVQIEWSNIAIDTPSSQFFD